MKLEQNTFGLFLIPSTVLSTLKHSKEASGFKPKNTKTFFSIEDSETRDQAPSADNHCCMCLFISAIVIQATRFFHNVVCLRLHSVYLVIDNTYSPEMSISTACMHPELNFLGTYTTTRISHLYRPLGLGLSQGFNMTSDTSPST